MVSLQLKKIMIMAKQMGVLKIRGTIDNLTFYKMRGKYYVRTKSSLTGERVKTDESFRPLMAYASLLAEASKIASAVYRLLSREKKKVAYYRKMTGRAMSRLKQGMKKEKIIELLMKKGGLLICASAKASTTRGPGNSCKNEKALRPGGCAEPVEVFSTRHRNLFYGTTVNAASSSFIEEAISPSSLVVTEILFPT